MNDRRQELNSNINLVKLTRTVFVLLFFSQISQLLDITHILDITVGESLNKTQKKKAYFIFLEIAHGLQAWKLHLQT